MTLRELQRIVNETIEEIEKAEIPVAGTEHGPENIPVVIKVVPNHTVIGGTPTVPVLAGGLGIDWDSGKFILVPETPVAVKEVET